MTLRLLLRGTCASPIGRLPANRMKAKAADSSSLAAVPDFPREGEAWVLPCEGLRVSQIRVDYAFGLELAEDQERATDDPWRFRINTQFTYASPTSTDQKLDPEGPPGALGPALSVRHQTLTRARLWPDGRLLLEFAGGDVITVASHDRYEAWEAHGSRLGEPIILISPIAPDTI